MLLVGKQERQPQRVAQGTYLKCPAASKSAFRLLGFQLLMQGGEGRGALKAAAGLDFDFYEFWTQ